jgi:regulator of sirC expression with transglutaminase-like and TPR domain
MEAPDTPARVLFASLLARPAIPLAEAALAVAAEEYPSLDLAACLAAIDALARRVEARLRPPPRPAVDVLSAMKAVVFEEAGFRGNHADYYDPRNSFLNEVLDRKLGVPITLSILYIEVAARCGLSLQGVGFPGHFLVKCPVVAGADETFIDPFNGGELLSHHECVARFRSSLHGREFDARFLEAVGPAQILTRMLHNLKKIYVEAGDDMRALWVIDRLLLLQPESLEERRDRGLLAARLGGTASAVKDLQAYLDGASQPSDGEEIRELLAELKNKTSYLN